MLRLAYRQLLLDRMRSALTVLAVAAVIAVILVLEGFELGLYSQLRRTVLERGADLIVAQAGVSNLLAARSSLPQLSRLEVEAIEGVLEAHPITGLPVIYSRNGRKTPIFLMVYDTMGGPANIWKGRSIRSGRDIVVGDALAEKYGLQVGDRMAISDFEFTVSGVTKDAAALFTPFAYINYDGLLDFFLESEIAPDISTFPLLSFLLVELSPEAEPKEVADRIEARLPSADVYTPPQMADSDANLGRDLFGPVMGLLLLVAYIIGLLVIGLITYADVNSRLRSFGVLKALGFRQLSLVKGVFSQTVLVIVTSFPLGVGFALVIAEIIHWVAPLYLVLATEPTIIVQTLIGAFLMACLGAFVPVRLLAGVDPIIAFSGD